MKVTFKKYPRETGLASVGNSQQSVNIKVDKKVVGIIHAPNWQTVDHKWSLSFSVIKDTPDDNPNCDWKWIFLKARFDTEEDARSFVIRNIDKLAEKYKFHYFVEDL